MIYVVMHINNLYCRLQSVQTYEQELELNVESADIPFVSESTGPVTDALFRITGPTSEDWRLRVVDNTSSTGFTMERYDPLEEGQYVVLDPGMYHAWRTDGDPSWDVRYEIDRKSTRLNSSHVAISYAVFCLKKKKKRKPVKRAHDDDREPGVIRVGVAASAVHVGSAPCVPRGKARAHPLVVSNKTASKPRRP